MTKGKGGWPSKNPGMPSGKNRTVNPPKVVKTTGQQVIKVTTKK